MNGNDTSRLILQERDKQLLRELEVMRVIDREQAKCVAGFGSTTRANTRLLALTRTGLLRRFFVGTEAVGRKAIYTLTRKGSRIVGSTYQGLQRQQDQLLVGDLFVGHQLEINELYCTLKFRPIPIPGVSFLRWVTFSEPLEPGVRLIPDGFFELQLADRRVAAFVEVDLGTETRTVWQAKVRLYRQYSEQEKFAGRFGLADFRVIVVASSERRRDSLREATSKITKKAFWLTDARSVREHGLWSAIWLRPDDQHLRPLLPLS